MVRVVSNYDNILIFGAFEGTMYDRYQNGVFIEFVDTRFRANFANGTTLSFGLTQLDPSSGNPYARTVLGSILQQAVDRGTISAAQRADLLRQASADNAASLLNTAERAILDSILNEPYARYAIEQADFQQIRDIATVTENIIAQARANWGGQGSSILDPSTGMAYLEAYAFLAATINKSPESNRAVILNFLSGNRVVLTNGDVFDLSSPPTIAQIHQFLGSMQAWQGDNGNYNFLKDRLDPLIDWMEVHPPSGPLGKRADLELPNEHLQGDYLQYASGGFEVDGEPGVLAFAYYDETKNALVLEKTAIDPNDEFGLLKDQIFLTFDGDGKIDKIEVYEQNETIELNLNQLEKSTAQLQALIDGMFPKLKYVDLSDLIGTSLVGGGATPSLLESFLTASVDQNGNLILTGHSARTLGFDPRTGIGRYAIDTGSDEFGRRTEQDWEFNSQTGVPLDTGVSRIRDGQVEIVAQSGEPTTIRLIDSPTGIDFVNAAETIAAVFGRHFIGGGELVQTLTSAALRTLASNFGDILNATVFDSGVATSKNIGDALTGMDAEFLANLKASGVGALSAYLTAELIDFVGLEGFEAEALNSVAGFALNQIIGNLTEMALGNPSVTSPFQGLENIAQIGNVAGSFLGNYLAAEIGSWDEIGEQLGSSIGGALGSIVGTALLAPIPVIGAIIGSFLGNLLGGLIGGVFTGTPKSGAILEFDAATGLFVVDQVWKEDGGSKRAAGELGENAAAALNSIISFVGGELVNGEEIEAGSYGMRGKRYVYWEDGTSSENRVKFKEAEDLIEYGVLDAVRDFEFLGGDVYAKRAFYNTLESAGLIATSAETGGDPELVPGQLYDSNPLTSVEFGLDSLLGNFAIVDRLHTYLQSSATINGLIAAEPDSALAADWLLAFSRIQDLGLLHRNSHDWDGGFTYLLQEAQVGARDVIFEFRLFGDGINGERRIYLGPMVMGDTIDSGSKTVIQGTADGDYLAASSSPGPGHIANVLHGGDGDDEILAGASGDELFGGAGNDQLVGGALDDWLIGGTGNDVLDGGDGNGNVLSGDGGDDRLVGRGQSDWLDGGTGADRLAGGAGDDILEGGFGEDDIDGGHGSDTVVYRTGTGADHVADTGTTSTDVDRLEFDIDTFPEDVIVVARSSGEAISVHMGELAAGDRIDLRGISYGERSGIDEFSFVYQTWDRGDLMSRAVFAKSAGAAVAGTVDDEELTGTIYDDSLTGAAGTDLLAGWFGSDVYTFNLGDGVDTIVEAGFAADLDTLLFGAGIATTDLTVAYSASQPHDLIVTVGAGGDQVILKDQVAPDGANSIEQILFADGTSWTIRDLIALAPSAAATSGADTLYGTYRPDVIAGGNGNDVLTGRLGDDNLDGGNGSDTYHYGLGDGDDRIHDSRHVDGGSSNVLVLGAGIVAADLVLARDQADTNNIRISFANAAGSILLDNQFYTTNYGWTLYDHGFDTIQFADGTQWNRSTLIAQSILQASTARSDFIQGSRFADTIDAGAGNDAVASGDDNDVLNGGVGDDSLDGGNGSDTYHYGLGDGDDRIVDSRHVDGGSTNTLVLGPGIVAADLILERDLGDTYNVRITFAGAAGSILLDNQLYWSDYAWNLYDHGMDIIRFADGTQWSRATLITQLLAQSSTADADVIQGTRFADTIDAGSGNDVVASGDEDDTLTGGLGNDNLDGGYGSDSYHYALGDGNDRIVDSRHVNSGATNILHLGAGITAADLILERDQGDSYNVRITFDGATGSILLDNQLYWTDYAYTIYDHGIDTIQFADSSSWSRATLITQILAQGSTDNADYLLATRFSDTINAGAGRDVVSTLDSNDDLDGGLGDDSLDGGFGSDSYHYASGGGHDRIIDNRHKDGGSTNTLVLGPGITAADLILERDQAETNNLRITFTSQTGSILLDDQFVITSYAGTQYKHGIDTIQFDDGTSWTRTQIESAVISTVNSVNGTSASETLNGTSGRDNIFGSGGNDTIFGGAGHDLLRGGSGNDTYRFNLGDGFDVVSEESGTDKVVFGVGIAVSDIVLSRPTADGDTTGVILAVAGTNDRLYVKSATGMESYEFADGTVWTEADLRTHLYAQLETAGADLIYGTGFNETIDGGAGADKIYAGAGADTVSGGAGSDLLDGGSGDDAYVFARGDGRDLITDESGATDTVRFGPDIDPADLILSRPHADDDTGGLLISIAGTEDQLYVKSATGIERYEFADGTIWTEAAMRAALFTQLLSDGADVIHGTGFADAIAGGQGADRIYAGGGNDVLEGGTGNDLIEGGAGNDSYEFNLGDGQDVIVEESGTDTIVFGEGIEAGDLRVARPVADGDTTGIIISIAGSDDRLYVKNAAGIESYEFADGTVLTESEMRALLFAQARTEGADIIQGSGLDDFITGGAGGDRIYGSSGSDVLGGGRGDDLLEGGTGNDAYVFNLGDGRDVLWDQSGTDAVRFGPGIEAGDVIVSRPLADGDTTGLVFTIRGTEDRLYVKSAATIEQFVFSDGTIWNYATAIALLDSSTVGASLLPVTAGDDVIFGTAQADTIRGMGGDEVLRGGAGSDTYRFALGDGYDVIYDPQSDGDTDTLILTDIASTMVRVITSPADPDDVVLFIDDANQVYLDQQKAGASGGLEQIQFSDGVTWTRQDILAKSSAAATAGNDTLVGTNFGESMAGALGDDLLIGRAGGDSYGYALGDGNDVIVEEGSAGTAPAGEEPGPADDRIVFASGITESDIVIGHGIGTDDVLITFAGAAGSILLSGQNAGSGSGVEFLLFNDGSSLDIRVLLAQSVAGAATGGADTIRGFFTADDLFGGLGDDTLEGGGGADRYHFNLGDGVDAVLEGGGADGGDELVLGVGIGLSNVSLRRRPDSPDDLILVIGDNGDEVRLTGQLSGRPGQGVEFVRFNDGTIWSREQIVEQYRTQPATEEADFLVGTDADDSFSGLEGDDLIEGGAGEDALGGGNGNDDLRGGVGEDMLTGGAGDDRLSGGFGEDGFDGGDGFDTLDYAFSLDNWTVDLAAGQAVILSGGAVVHQESFTSMEAVVGGAGQDTLIGNDQANRIEGSEGNDLLSGGGENDVFVYRGSEAGLDQVDGGSGTDRIEAAEDETVIGLASLQNVEQISGNGYSGVMVTGTDLAETLDLASVSVTGVSLIYMAAGNDVLVGAAGSDNVDLGLGDDVVRVSGDLGADAVVGGDGTDRIEAAADDTVIRLSSLASIEQISAAGFGNVSVAGTALGDILNLTNVTLTGIVRIDGGDGDDALTGSAQADTLRGGGGNDTLIGGAGNDIFEIAAESDGVDTIDGGTGTDQILAVAQGVIIRLAAPTIGIEAITGLGSALVYGTLNDSINLSGVTLTGIASIDGGAGTDTIIASAVADTILAGAGNDTLTGNGGNDTYVFNLGDGQDLLQEYANTGGGSGGVDALVFGAGIDADHVTISKTGNDVILTIVPTGEAVTIKSQAGSTTSYWVEEVRFSDGTVWDRATTIGTATYGTSAADTMAGTSGADIFFALDGDDVLTGLAGADRLYGGDGADTINGGSGDDGIYGGAGDDVFQYGAAGDGYDYVGGGAGTDTIVATANSTWIGLRSLSGIEAISSGGFSNVSVWGSTAADTLSFAGVTLTGIVKIDGYDGNDTLTGSSGADTIVGGSGNDVIAGGLGNDSIDGGSGTDTVDYSAESAAWTINLAAPSNHAQSGSETDSLASIENVTGGSGADTITGSTAANVLTGGGGEDRLTGGAGNDAIQGGLGTDVAVFAGLQASYSIVTAGGSIQIVDNQTSVDGNDGTDTLAGVEIAEFKNGVQVTLAAPIVLDLDGDGVDLISRASSHARWDWNDDGIADRTGWVGSGDGILVYDRDRNGTVSNATEMSFVDDAAGARSDLDGLAAFDTSGDGLLSAGDAAWADFRIWADRDLDGQVDVGEMLSMAEARVASISVAGDATEQAWGWEDNIIINNGQFTRVDGSTSALADVAFNYLPATNLDGPDWRLPREWIREAREFWFEMHLGPAWDTRRSLAARRGSQDDELSTDRPHADLRADAFASAFAKTPGLEDEARGDLAALQYLGGPRLDLTTALESLF